MPTEFSRTNAVMAARVARARAFWRRENERPLLGFFIGSEYPLPRYPQTAAALPEGRPLAPADLPMEAFLADAEALFAAHEACGGDLVYAASAYWGVPWLEAALGCPITASRTTGSLVSHPPAAFAGPQSIPAFDPGSPWVARAGEMLARLAQRSAGRFPLATTRMRGVADLLAALYGGEAFVFKMMTEPEEVAEAARRLAEFFIAFGRYQLERIPLFHGGVGSFYYHLWCPPGTLWHQEDAAALLSPELYATFIRPADEAITRAFAGVVMHTHSTGFVPYEAYLEMGMAAIEIHIDEGGPSAEMLYEKHRQVQCQRPLIIWGRIPEADQEWIFNKLPPQGLAVAMAVETPEEAHALLARWGAR